MIHLDLTTIDWLGDAAVEHITLADFVPTVAVLTERKAHEEDQEDRTRNRRAWEGSW